jgi:hypothetical protein
LVWATDRLVLAWVDALTVQVREYTAELDAIGQDLAIATPSGVESAPAVAAIGSGWAVATRSSVGGSETIRIRSGANEWTTGPFLPGAPDERPALAALDAETLLVVFTEGVDPLQTGTANVFRLRGALLSSAAVGPTEPFWLEPLSDAYAGIPDVQQRHPSVTVDGPTIYVAWQAEGPAGTEGQSSALLTKLLRTDQGELQQEPETRLRLNSAPAARDLRPHVAFSPWYPGGATVALWNSSPPAMTGARPLVMYTVLSATQRGLLDEP